MDDDLTPSIPAVPIVPTLTLGDRIRGIANQLRQESDIQIKATSRILGAAAQIAQNHDRLIDEVVDMVEEDLNQPTPLSAAEPYTVERLKQQFNSLKAAKAHFGIKAGSWEALITKLNEPTAQQRSPASTTPASKAKNRSPASKAQEPKDQRLEIIEQDIQAIKSDINQILTLLNLMIEKLP